VDHHVSKPDDLRPGNLGLSLTQIRGHSRCRFSDDRQFVKNGSSCCAIGRYRSFVSTSDVLHDRVGRVDDVAEKEASQAA
jgi:hypothetical protein